MADKGKNHAQDNPEEEQSSRRSPIDSELVFVVFTYTYYELSIVKGRKYAG